MMKSRKSKKLDSEIYAKSADGLWAKANLVDSGIELFWQVRTKVSGKNLLVFDINGSVESSIPRERAIYPEHWRSAGIIPVDDDFVEFCGIDRFDETIAAVMRHATYMLAGGYGDEPEDIIEWFTDMREKKFLSGTAYKFIKDCDPFVDLVGIKGVVNIGDDDKFVLKTMVRDTTFDMILDSDKVLTSFMVATVPV